MRSCSHKKRTVLVGLKLGKQQPQGLGEGLSVSRLCKRCVPGASGVELERNKASARGFMDRGNRGVEVDPVARARRQIGVGVARDSDRVRTRRCRSPGNVASLLVRRIFERNV